MKVFSWIRCFIIISCLLFMGCLSSTPSKFGDQFNKYEVQRYYTKDSKYTGYSITTKHSTRYYTRDSKFIGYSK